MNKLNKLEEGLTPKGFLFQLLMEEQEHSLKFFVKKGCSSDIASSYYFRQSKVTEHVGSVGTSLKQNKKNLKKPNPNP